MNSFLLSPHKKEKISNVFLITAECDACIIGNVNDSDIFFLINFTVALFEGKYGELQPFPLLLLLQPQLNECTVMDRKDKKIQKESIATRDKGLVIVRELDRLVRAINKALKNRDDRAKSIEAELQELGKTLKKNLDSQYKVDRDFDDYDTNIGKIFSNLQLLEDEEETYTGQYQHLLNGNKIADENQKSDNSLSDDSIPTEEDSHELATLEKLKQRREIYFQNLNEEFLSLEDKLSSIGKLRSELENSHNEIGEKKAHTLDKKKVLEEEGNKLLSEVGNLENELEITILEEKNLLEESFKMINRIESCLGIDEKIGQVLFSSQAAIETDETSSVSRLPENGHKIAMGT